MTATDISFKRIQQLAIPAIIAGIAEPVLSSTDAAVVGNIPGYGTEALASVGIVGAFLSALIWILGQTRSAISAIISQNLGAGKIEDLKSFPAQAVYFNVIISIVVLISTYFFVEEIFSLLNAKGLILDFSIAYYDIRVWGFPLTLFTFAVFGIFRGLQNTFWPMIIAAIGAAVNIGLDFLFVYGLNGYVEAMGVVGAAWASLIAQGVMALLSLVLLLKKTAVSLRLKFPLHPEIKRLVSMSANLFLRSVALNVALILSTREAAGLGTEVVAAHTIALNIWLFTAFFLDGYGAAGNILGGKLMGENNFNSLWQLTKRVLKYNLIVATGLIIIGVIFYEQLGWIYNKDPKVLGIYSSIFFLVLVSLPFNAIAFTLDSIFKGLGEMGYLRNVLLASTFLGFVPVLFITKYLGWELYGIWTALIVWVAWRGLALVIKYRNKYIPLISSNQK
ncbi:MATE family efflux transporter [Patiriisocius marinus]|uniref:Multidrug-efflux transporter n=1 Tax=Patiriisocius marinus TaxID=1397112 RepID=A0A5J4IMQ5_9FLAO|nr:MATE family efflux transporter [Patiriisocius marinus]GER58575.1 MATE family efflux transporter [Patiriisocius marinus]